MATATTRLRNSYLARLLEKKTKWIPGACLDDATIAAAQLAASSVTTAKIAAAAVTGAKTDFVKTVTSAALDHLAFTDGGSAAATIDIGVDIPVGAFVLGWSYTITEDVAVQGAAGETGYSLQLGDGSDADRFDPTTDPTETIASQSATEQLVVPLFGVGGSGDGQLFTSAAVSTPTLTLTLTGGTPDASNFVHADGAGKFIVQVLYLDLAALFAQT